MDQPTKSELIFGLRPLLEAIQAKKTIEKIIIQKELQGDLFKELNETLKKGDKIPVQMVPKEALNKLTQENHQGMLLIYLQLNLFQLNKEYLNYSMLK